MTTNYALHPAIGPSEFGVYQLGDNDSFMLSAHDDLDDAHAAIAGYRAEEDERRAAASRREDIKRAARRMLAVTVNTDAEHEAFMDAALELAGVIREADIDDRFPINTEDAARRRGDAQDAADGFRNDAGEIIRCHCGRPAATVEHMTFGFAQGARCADHPFGS